MFGAKITNKRFEQVPGNWNAHLSVKVASNSRDDTCSGSNARLASDYNAIAAQRDEGLALLRKARAWIEAARGGVLYPIDRDFDGVVGFNAEGLGQQAPQLLDAIDQALAGRSAEDVEKAPTPELNLPRRKVKTECSTAEEDAQA